MVNVKKKTMLMLGKRMQELIESTPFKVGENTLKLTFTQGCVLIGRDLNNEELIKELDELLKKGIEAGGNQLNYHVY